MMENNKLQELILFDKMYNNSFTIGVDEAGRGPLAGSVVASTVLFDEKIANNEIFSILNDSKKLTEKKREFLYNEIINRLYYGIGIANELEIDNNNILNATFIAMKKALEELKRKVGKEVLECGIILVDGSQLIRGYEYSQKSVVKGDSKSFSVAAASIVAKVTRDNMMKEIDREFPMYNFAKNKGYGTKQHIESIYKYGICKYHRKSFLKNILKDIVNVEEKLNIEEKNVPIYENLKLF